MFRFRIRPAVVSIWLIVLVLLGRAVPGGSPTAFAAQEGTPVSEDEQQSKRVSFESVGFGVASVLPSAPADVELFRLGIDPGADFPLLEENPSLALIIVESGEVILLADIPITVSHASGGMETIPAGKELTMEAGDSVTVPPLVAGEVRNDSNEEASMLVVNIFPHEGSEGATPETSLSKR